jgi:hypothetical protein
MSTRKAVMTLAALVLATSCNQCKPKPPPDPDPYQPVPPECVDSECSDGNPCNGEERCNLETDSCVPVAHLCLGQACRPDAIDPAMRCSDCALGSDWDGDLLPDMACEPSSVDADCDDWDDHAGPGVGNDEKCEAGAASRSIDEDCDPTTFGRDEDDPDDDSDNDVDEDGHVLDECCNFDPVRSRENCGDDCDDNDATRFRGATELCNRRDDDCDRQIDEDIAASETFYADCDGDGLGRDNWKSVDLCLNLDHPPDAPVGCPSPATAAWSTSRNDCNDSNPDIRAKNCEPNAVRPCDDTRCSGLSTSQRSPLNRYVNRCNSTYCEWDDLCAPESALVVHRPSQLQTFGTQACKDGNPCGCSGSSHVCAPGDGSTTIARIAVGLPEGRYAIAAQGRLQADAATNITLRSGELDVASVSASGGVYNLSGEMMVLGECSVPTIDLNRNPANVAVSVETLTIWRLP